MPISPVLLPEGIEVGHAENTAGGSGCTVVLCRAGGAAGVAIHGGAPASHETELLRPENTVQHVHAIVLAGGSAFGLAACSGVMRYLEAAGVGFAVAGVRVPIVCGAALFDLPVGDPRCRPDAEMGEAACRNAGSVIATGNVGAGCGATAGKLLGMEYAMKTGFGAATRREGDLIVTALVAVNAIGGVLDRASGKILAGARETRNGKVRVLSVEETLRRAVAPRSADAHTPNTTLGVIVTNARLSKGEAAKLAVRAHDGYARAIDPVHSSLDGDTIFTLATATVTADIDLVGWLATEAMETAVHSAAKTAETAYGFPAMRDM